MPWAKSSNYKVAYTAYADNLTTGNPGDLFVQGGQLVRGKIINKTKFLDSDEAYAVPLDDMVSDGYYDAAGSCLLMGQKRLEDGSIVKYPFWSNTPVLGINFDSGINVSGYWYRPLKFQICNGGLNYTIEFLARIVP
jgi:hypothetical protein